LRTADAEVSSVRAVGRSIAGVLASLTLAASVVGCGTDTPPRPGTQTAVSWSELGLPYLTVDRTDADVELGISYGDASVALTASPEYADSGDATGMPEVQSMTATSDAALITLGSPGDAKAGEVWQLRDDGSWTRVGTEVRGIPLADLTGTLAVWTEVRQAGPVVVAFDTTEGRIVEEQLTDTLIAVTAVRGSTAYFVGDLHPWRWDIGKGDSPQIAPDVPDKPGEIVSAFDPKAGLLRASEGRTILVDETGKTVQEFERDLFGLFNPDGSAVALAGWSGYQAFDLAKGGPVALDLPEENLIFAFAWGTDGHLVVYAGVGESEEAQAYACSIPSGACEPLGKPYPAEFGPRYIESSSRGQFAALEQLNEGGG
jgi:hypothetical protein